LGYCRRECLSQFAGRFGKKELELSGSVFQLQATVKNLRVDPEPQRRLRIGILDHTARLGGGEIALLNLAKSIDHSRFDLTVILFSDGQLREKLQQHGIKTLIVPLDPRIGDARKDNLGGGLLGRLGAVAGMAGFIRRLSRELKQNNIDIVHTNSLKSDILGGLAGRLAGIPVIWHIRDRIADDYLPRSVATVFRVLTRIIPKRVVTNSYATLSTLRLRRPGDMTVWKNPKFSVVHDGTEVNPLPSFAADPNTLVVGLVGRISPWKGQDVFLRAISLMRAQCPAAKFQIIGSAMFCEARYDKEIRELSTSLGLDDVVVFMGFRSDVPDLVDRMDLLVHASTIGEPFGQVILEGMAAGKAVVATRGGGVPEFVTDGTTGLLVPMGDPQAMAAAMSRLLSDANLRAEMGQRARQSVIDGFTIQHTADKMQAVYDRMRGAVKARDLSMQKHATA
jgi:glycosyltransferase involved in cell wall biosynthesis